MNSQPSSPEEPRPFVHHLLAPDEGHEGGIHVSNLGLAQVLFESRNRYFENLAVPGGIWNGRILPMIRELTIRFEGEVRAGTPLHGSVCIVGRGRKALFMDEIAQDVSDPDAPRTIVSARSVHVTVDTQAGGAVAVPASLIEFIETVQGAPVPEVARTP